MADGAVVAVVGRLSLVPLEERLFERLVPDCPPTLELMLAGRLGRGKVVVDESAELVVEGQAAVSDLVEDGLGDEEGVGQVWTGQEIKLVQDCVRVWQDPRESGGEDGRRSKVGGGAEVVLPDDCGRAAEWSVPIWIE